MQVRKDAPSWRNNVEMVGREPAPLVQSGTVVRILRRFGDMARVLLLTGAAAGAVRIMWLSDLRGSGL